MKYTRAILTGVLLWAFVFVVMSILMFAPGLKDQVFFQYLIMWVLLIPVTLFVAKWYFHVDEPTSKKGFLLGILVLITGTVLDAIISVPVFVKSYTVFYSNTYLYIGMLEILLLMTYAGYEFDSTYTKDTDK